MVLVAFFQVFLTVLDRIIYLKQNRTHVVQKNLYYNKGTGEEVGEEMYKNIASESGINSYFQNIYFQSEETNLPLICKYILHLFIVCYCHVFIFWYLVMQGNINLNSGIVCEGNNCNDFTGNRYLIVFYLLFVCYLTFSGLQIQYGLLDLRKKSLLMRKENLIYSTSLRVFNAIPFLYELKLLIDWSITPTALDLFQWIKFESLYDLMFLTHVSMKADRYLKPGTLISKYMKALLGGCGFLIVLLILLGPLLLFSSLNPTNEFNDIYEAKIEISISFKTNNLFRNFSLYTNNQALTINNSSKQKQI